MDQAAALGPLIAEVAPQTFQIYGKLLGQSDIASKINTASYETFSYGSHEKQKLDLYLPPSDAPATGKARPVLIFIHGGAFVSGGRIAPEIPGGLVYKNVGYFFAHSAGFEVVIPSYRLLPDGAKYPSGADDIDGVFDWVKTHYDGAHRDIFLVGNSAGGANVGAWLLEKRYRTSRTNLLSPTSGVVLKAVVLLGTPCAWDLDGGMKDILLGYYGGPEAVKEGDLTNLLSKVADHGDDVVSKLSKLLVVVSELDPEDGIKGPSREFYQQWTSLGGTGDYIEIQGHTHLSTPMALGSGIEAEEAWGVKLAQSLQSLVQS